nr:uncharacterized protein LOC113826956 [Penaeus vannamei]
MNLPISFHPFKYTYTHSYRVSSQGQAATFTLKKKTKEGNKKQAKIFDAGSDCHHDKGVLIPAARCKQERVKYQGRRGGEGGDYKRDKKRDKISSRGHATPSCLRSSGTLYKSQELSITIAPPPSSEGEADKLSQRRRMRTMKDQEPKKNEEEKDQEKTKNRREPRKTKNRREPRKPKNRREPRKTKNRREPRKTKNR